MERDGTLHTINVLMLPCSCWLVDRPQFRDTLGNIPLWTNIQNVLKEPPGPYPLCRAVDLPPGRAAGIAKSQSQWGQETERRVSPPASTQALCCSDLDDLCSSQGIETIQIFILDQSISKIASEYPKVCGGMRRYCTRLTCHHFGCLHLKFLFSILTSGTRRHARVPDDIANDWVPPNET